MPGKLFQPESASQTLPTVVVLPLVDMSIDQTEQALCDGLTEELSNWLAHIPTLRVVARTSAFAFKGQNIDVRTIARELGATHVLEGSLRRSGDQLRITTQLIEAEAGLHIWSKSFDLPIGDIFLIEDTVSRSVAEALHLELASNTAEQWAQRQPEKMEAYELYLLGRARLRKRTPDDNLKAADFFRRAVAADPQYALAHVGLAQSLINGLSLNRAPLEDVSAEAEPLLNRALALSPDLPDAYAVKGLLLTAQFKLDEAIPLLQRATAANPNDAFSHRFLGDLYDKRADPKTALTHYSTAASLDPLDFISHVFRCQVLTDLGEFKEADAACARARQLEPTNIWGPLTTSWIARARGDMEGTNTWLAEARRIAPRDETVVDQVVEMLVTQGRTGDARALMQEFPGGYYALAREASLVTAEGGPDGLRSWLKESKIAEQAVAGVELVELARLQYIAGDASVARATQAHAQRILPLSSADLFDGGQIRHDYSAALFRAGIELKGGGDTRYAMGLLNQVDRLLESYERNGGQHYGLYSLRAASLAMQGKKAEAQLALDQAWKKGWRTTWRARADPYLRELKIPGD
jgi:TolB-like protein/predicted Zn-dependent protease